MKAFVFDLDGTLARRVDRGPYDMTTIQNDEVNEKVLWCLEALYRADFALLIFTGRDEVFREKTERWLRDKGVGFDRLVMRPEGSKERDDKVKLDMLRQIQEEGLYEIVGVFEDRKRVKRMWVQEGVWVFDVNQTDEEF